MYDGPRRKPAATVSNLLALNWLGTDQHAAGVLATAQNLLAAEHELARVLPPAIAVACRVAQLDRQRITLAVPSAAYASKLRQLGPRVLTQLNSAGWNLNEVGVRVQGTLAQSATQLSVRNIEPLGVTALTAFGELSHHLAPGPLADAVERLLSRHSPHDD